MGTFRIFILSLLIGIASCNNKSEDKSEPTPNSYHDLIINKEVINHSFVGNGVQWGGYDNISIWTGNTTLSENDWNTLFTRMRYMRPPLIRLMVSSGWNYMDNNRFNPSKSEGILFKILDFCQKENIAVMFGEWGHSGGTSIDEEWLENSAKFIEYLLNDKQYSCIKYFNMVNEPNGDWSSINGNYPLWKDLIEKFYDKLQNKGLTDKIKLIGPDIAIWDTNSTWWVSNAKNDLGNKIGAYDIHTYPTESIVRDATYSNIIQAYKNSADATKEMLMGELGFKYAPVTTLGKENAKRIAADKNASDDSNMMVYESFYGIDMADAIIQNMRSGYGGVIMWMLDDAMYTKESDTRLKRWGFWNIMGAEKFNNPSDENIRPWFYPMSLLCRYFPSGTKIFSVELPNKFGVRAIAGEKDGKYTIAIVNSHTVSASINLRMQDGVELINAKIFEYQSKEGADFIGKTNVDGFAEPKEVKKLNLKGTNFSQMDIPAKSFYLITNMD